MNPELQKELAAWLSQLRGSASFVVEQAPIVVQEKLAYGRAAEVAYLLGAIAMIVVAYWCAKHAMRWFTKYDHPFGFIGAGILGLLGPIWFLIQLDAVLKVWLAPRLYVIEWLAGLVAGGK